MNVLQTERAGFLFRLVAGGTLAAGMLAGCSSEGTANRAASVCTADCARGGSGNRDAGAAIDGSPARGDAGARGGSATGGASNGGTRSTGGATVSNGTGGVAMASGGKGGASTASGGNGGNGGVATASGGAMTMDVCKSTTPVGAGGSAPSGPTPALEAGVWVDITPPGLLDPQPSNPPFGITDVALDPTNPATLFVSTDMEGIWKSTDAGSTWEKHNANLPAPFSGSLRIDPRNHDHMYFISAVRGNALGFWTSCDGGMSWSVPPAFAAGLKTGPWNNDVGHIAVDPGDFNHFFLTFHSPWDVSTGATGFLESQDGGASFTVHEPDGRWGGASEAINFMWDPDRGLGDSKLMLINTQFSGFWRSADGGKTWVQVSTETGQHGGAGVFLSKTGVAYTGCVGQIMRSTDLGMTWDLVGPKFRDGYYAVIGDGNLLYTQVANTGYNTVGPQPYITSPEPDGVTWTPFQGGAQEFKDGPYSMVLDRVNHIIYSANWNAGLWALKVKP